MMMNMSKLVIVALWLWIVGSSAIQGFNLPTSELARNFSLVGTWIIALPIVIAIGPLFSKQLPGGTILGERVDSKYGRGTYLRFLKRLKLELLFASMAFSIGVIGLLRSLGLGGPRGAFIISGFFLSAGIAFLVAHFVMRQRGFYNDKVI